MRRICRIRKRKLELLGPQPLGHKICWVVNIFHVFERDQVNPSDTLWRNAKNRRRQCLVLLAAPLPLETCKFEELSVAHLVGPVRVIPKAQAISRAYSIVSLSLPDANPSVSMELCRITLIFLVWWKTAPPHMVMMVPYKSMGSPQVASATPCNASGAQS